RSRLLRTARVVLGVRVLRAPSIGLLSAASRVAGAMGWTRAGLAGLSLVYALEYDRGRKAGRAGSAWTGSVEGEPARERSADVVADSTEGSGPTAEGEQAASEHSPAGTTNRNGPGHPSPALAGSRADGGSASGR